MGHHSDSKTTYKQEFFDREYSAKEAYGRLWGFTRKYRLRIYLGVLCGMLTAGTLLPLFQVIQPALDKVGGGERGAAGEVNGQDARSQSCGQDARHPDCVVDGQDARHPDEVGQEARSTRGSKEERKVLKEYGKFKKLAQKLGFELQDEDEALGAPLLFACGDGALRVSIPEQVLSFVGGPAHGEGSPMFDSSAHPGAVDAVSRTD